MFLKLFIILSLALVGYSCFSLSIDKVIEVNENEDWLYIGGDLAKTNTSRSKSILNPPFNLYWQFDTDGGLAKNCLSVSDAVLFANTLNGEFYAIDITSGKSLGRTSTLGRSSYSTPVIFKNNIIIASSGDKDSKLFSYNLITGIIQWQRNVGWVESSPVMVGNNVIISSLNGEIYNINARTGSINCTAGRFDKKSSPESFYTSPTIVNNMVLAGNSDGYMYSFDDQSCNSLWKFKTNSSIFCDASVSNGKIYFGSDDDNFYCIDTSGNFLWKKNLNTKFLSSSTFYNDLVITAGVDGNVYAMNKNNGDSAWIFHTKGTIEASPVLHMDKIFIGSFDKNFYCLNAENGKELWRYESEGRIKTSAVIWKDYIFVGGDDKYIYCFSNLVKQIQNTNK